MNELTPHERELRAKRDPIREAEMIDVRTRAWSDVYRSLRNVRDIMIEDNGNTRSLDPDDPFLADTIHRIDALLVDWDPDATPEEHDNASR
jgi:hypothetical protein